MSRHDQGIVLFFLVLVLCMVTGSGVATAQQTAAEPEGPTEEVIVVGSRRRDRSASDSPVPVDVAAGDEFLAQGNADMDDVLAALIPSYNVAPEPISDAATFIRPATLRALP